MTPPPPATDHRSDDEASQAPAWLLEQVRAVVATAARLCDLPAARLELDGDVLPFVTAGPGAPVDVASVRLPVVIDGRAGRLVVAGPAPDPLDEARLDGVHVLACHAARMLAAPARLRAVVAGGVGAAPAVHGGVGALEADGPGALRLSAGLQRMLSLPPRYAGAAAAPLVAATASAGERPADVRLVDGDGDLRQLQVLAATATDAAGEPVRRAVVLDLTELGFLTAFADELAGRRAAQAELQAVLDGMAVAVAQLDPDGRVRAVNRPLLELAGGTADALVGRPLADDPRWADARTRRAVRAAIAAAGAGDDAVVEGEADVPAGRRVLRVELRPLRAADGSVRSIVGTGHDVTERRRSEALLEAAGRVARLAGWSVRHGRLDSTEMLRDLLGLPDVRARDVASLMHPADRAALQAELEALGGRRLQLARRIRFLRADDGREVVLECRGHLDWDPAAERVSGEGVLQDVTEAAAAAAALRRTERRAQEAELEVARRQAEQAHVEALEATHRQLQAVIDGVPALVFAKDLDGRYLFANRAFGELVGIDPEAVVGRQVDALGLGYDPEEVARHDAAVLREGRTIRAEVVIDAADGTRRRFLSEKSPLRDADGAVYAICGVSTDVTAARRAEEAARRRAEQHRRVGAFAALVAEDEPMEDVRTAALAAACAALGAPGSMLVRVPADAPPFAVAATGAVALTAAASAAAAEAAGTQRAARRPGLLAVPVPSPGDVGKAFVVCRDEPFGEDDEHVLAELARLVAVARARTQARELERRLERASRLEAVGKLAGGLAHDFNNELSVIANFTAFVQEGLPADDPAQEMLAQSRAAADRAAELTRRLLLFGRVHRDTAETASPALVLRAAAGGLGPHVDVEVSCPPAVQVAMAPAELELVVAELVANARDAGGDVHVQVEARDRYVRLVVADDGRGMAAADVDRAAEPFFTTKSGARGMGLATVHGIVRRAGGHHEVASTPGAGTTVVITLPVADAPAPAAAAPAPPREHLDVLVVDDQPGVRDLVARILARDGHEVRVAGDAATARALAQEAPFDLLVTDVVMPDEAGPSLAASLPGAPDGFRTLFMTGYADDVTGVDGARVIHKPFDRAGLLQAVRAAGGLDPAPAT